MKIIITKKAAAFDWNSLKPGDTALHTPSGSVYIKIQGGGGVNLNTGLLIPEGVLQNSNDMRQCDAKVVVE